MAITAAVKSPAAGQECADTSSDMRNGQGQEAAAATAVEAERAGQ
jgi:hypothetical protein